MRTTFLALCIVLSISCGGDDDPKPVDAGVADVAVVSIDAAAPDADVMGACTMYCSCMDERCAGSFATIEECMTACTALDSAAQDCRLEHCGLAVPGQEAVHCPHARGEAVCD